jgi:hypothetical protein
MLEKLALREFCDLYMSPGVTRSVRWAVPFVRMEKRNSCRGLVGRP